jgi:hypothetical protein
MAKLVIRVDPAIREVLDGSGLSWCLTKGKRHYQVRLDGKLVGILPYGKVVSADRDLKNMVASIRRTLKEQQV